jgi:hypothetical protein
MGGVYHDMMIQLTIGVYHDMVVRVYHDMAIVFSALF